VAAGDALEGVTTAARADVDRVAAATVAAVEQLAPASVLRAERETIAA
jgi:hypothetical protein